MPEIIIDGYPVKYWNNRQFSNYRPLREFLIEKFKVCYHCHIPVKEYPITDGVGLLPDQATIDHLKPRPERKKFEVVEKVLSCHQCNQDRDFEYRNKKSPAQPGV